MVIRQKNHPHRAMRVMSRFAIGVIAQVSLKNGEQQANLNSRSFQGRARVDFLFGFGKRVRTGWLPYIRRWARYRKGADTDIGEDGKKPEYVGTGLVEVPRVGTRVLVAFIGNDYDDGVILGCIPDSDKRLPVWQHYAEFKTGDIAYAGPNVALGVISEGREPWQQVEDAASSDQIVLFNNSKEAQENESGKEEKDRRPYYIKFDMGKNFKGSSLTIAVDNLNITAADGVKVISFSSGKGKSAQGGGGDG